jgi:glycosyltransferase involved in cell wall biosynthesis
MVTSKNVHLIIQNFKESEIKHSHRLILAGGYVDKNVRSELKKLTNEDGIKYIGEYSSHSSLKSLLKQVGCDSGFFISWNNQEPFGLVYQEAIELNLLPLLPVQIGFTELLDDKLVEQLTFNSLENAFSAISTISPKVSLHECQMPLKDDINKFFNYTVDDRGY